MKILAFAASSSSQSINKKLLEFVTTQLPGHDVELIDLNDYEMPIYSQDKEAAKGIPQEAHDFYRKIGEADALLISYAEHNASYTSAYKNLFDWTSRIDMKVYQSKPAVLFATSPGPGGAKNVLSTAVTSAPYFGMDVKSHLSIASFYDSFDAEKGEPKDKTTLDNIAETLEPLLSFELA